MKQPVLSFWQVWNVSFGFLGVQIGFALQNANVSRVLSDLGADLHSLSLFWLVAPIMGLLVQPVVGAASDKTWNRLGRRNPYILAGALAAAIAMAMMPNAPLFVTLLSPIIFGAVMLALMDASFNVAFQPFRALVADMVPPKQHNQGYAVQSLLINLGAIFGSMLPFLLTNVVGLDNASRAGSVAPSVVWAFYIGATVLLGSVLWTVFKTKEYPPAQYYAYKGLDGDKMAREIAHKKRLGQRLAGFWALFVGMPKVMRQLAVVQFFSWFAFFIMWVYSMPAITQYVWGVEAMWFDPAFIAAQAEVPEHIAMAKGAAGDWIGIISAAYFVFAALFATVMSKLAKHLGRKGVYALGLGAGAIGFFSFMLFNNPELTQVDLGVTVFEVPKGALGLLLPMIGIGMAWTAMLAMPYSILASSLPADKTGVYMGIFNFTIAAPQIVSGLVSGWVLSNVFDNEAIYIIMMAGASMLLAAAAVYFVDDPLTANADDGRGVDGLDEQVS